MINGNVKPRGIELDLKELCWRLLNQWKAIVLVCLFFSLAFSMGKYYNDLKAYNTGNASDNSEAVSIEDAQNRINTIIEQLSEGDRVAVNHVIRQGESLADKSDYMDKSILMNIDPYNVNTLVMGFKIDNISDSDKVDAIYEGYASAFDNDEAIIPLCEAVSPGTPIEYIRELVFFDYSFGNYSVGNLSARDRKTNVFHVMIALPDDVDINTVAKAIEQIVRNRNNELINATCDHTVSVDFTDQYHAVNSVIARKKSDEISWLNNTQVNQKNAIAALTEPQYKAYNEIQIIQGTLKGEAIESQESTEAETIKPSISKRMIVFGGVVGLFLYVMIYTAYLVINGKVNYASYLRNYTNYHTIGEVYLSGKKEGILHKLLNSNFLISRRFAGISDKNGQIDKLALRIIELCRRNGINQLSVVCLSESQKAEKVGRTLTEICANNGIAADVSLTAYADSNVNTAVVVADNSTKVNTLEDFTENMKAYKVNTLGSVYVW